MTCMIRIQAAEFPCLSPVALAFFIIEAANELDVAHSYTDAAVYDWLCCLVGLPEGFMLPTGHRANLERDVAELVELLDMQPPTALEWLCVAFTEGPRLAHGWCRAAERADELVTDLLRWQDETLDAGWAS